MRIKQGTNFLINQLRYIEEGLIVPAAFQRPYVWDEAAVLAFIESILRGYPVGGLLMWVPASSVPLPRAARGRLGPIPLAETGVPASLLLDGQNRLATLAWMGKHPETEMPADLSEAEAQVWGSNRRLVLDLQAHTVAFVPSDEADQGLRLPAYAALDGRKANALLRARWNTAWSPFSDAEKDAGLGWLDKVQYAFREARVTVTDIEDATAEEAKDAFLHICRVGVPMSAADLEAALSWAL